MEEIEKLKAQAFDLVMQIETLGVQIQYLRERLREIQQKIEQEQRVLPALLS